MTKKNTSSKFRLLLTSQLVKIMNDYGDVNADTPSFAISLYKDFREYDIGTMLMKQMLEYLKKADYKNACWLFKKKIMLSECTAILTWKTVDRLAN